VLLHEDGRGNQRPEPLDPETRRRSAEITSAMGSGALSLEAGPAFDPNGRTFIDGVTLGIADAQKKSPSKTGGAQDLLFLCS